jgi:hypothetical protein
MRVVIDGSRTRVTHRRTPAGLAGYGSNTIHSSRYTATCFVGPFADFRMLLTHELEEILGQEGRKHDAASNLNPRRNSIPRTAQHVLAGLLLHFELF